MSTRFPRFATRSWRGRCRRGSRARGDVASAAPDPGAGGPEAPAARIRRIRDTVRAILFDRAGRSAALARRPLPQSYPGPGLVEHDPTRIWDDALAVCREVLGHGGATAEDVAAIGITNQRETVVIWDRESGKPVHPAIVWQDRRTAETCQRLREEGHEEAIRSKTGLLLDPYFSTTKVKWLLDHVEGARPAAEAGELAFGTIDSWLLWNLTGGEVHATDATNASTTLLFDIHQQRWDEDLLRLFGVPGAISRRPPSDRPRSAGGRPS